MKAYAWTVDEASRKATAYGEDFEVVASGQRCPGCHSYAAYMDVGLDEEVECVFCNTRYVPWRKPEEVR